MSSTRRFSRATALQRRPAGPRCHGGASSLLRLAGGALPQRGAASRAADWRELSGPADSAAVEHIVGWPGRADRTLAS